MNLTGVTALYCADCACVGVCLRARVQQQRKAPGKVLSVVREEIPCSISSALQLLIAQIKLHGVNLCVAMLTCTTGNTQNLTINWCQSELKMAEIYHQMREATTVTHRCVSGLICMSTELPASLPSTTHRHGKADQMCAAFRTVRVFGFGGLLRVTPYC